MDIAADFVHNLTCGASRAGMTSVWMEGVRRKESARNQPRVQPIGSLGGLWRGLQLVWNRRTGSLETEMALMARCVNVIESPALLQTGRAKLAFFLGQKSK